ncbi:hypothetical protein ADINL_1951 [Nitrincola lacisaponensis]|uniref:Uncharacterized protein n=1 Tax=Nitrincola lacisaponensis TaxID=267850 RepID=A0A063Y4S8_9GAMM|nr:hypothetical protein ADINL_1951 [Nitrincola lacisaponensis]
MSPQVSGREVLQTSSIARRLYWKTDRKSLSRPDEVVGQSGLVAKGCS